MSIFNKQAPAATAKYLEIQFVMSIEFFTILISVRLSHRSEVTQHKINFVKNCSQWRLNSQPLDNQSDALTTDPGRNLLEISEVSFLLFHAPFHMLDTCCLFLKSIEHDFTKALMIHTHNYIGTGWGYPHQDLMGISPFPPAGTAEQHLIHGGRRIFLFSQVSVVLIRVEGEGGVGTSCPGSVHVSPIDRTWRTGHTLPGPRQDLKDRTYPALCPSDRTWSGTNPTPLPVSHPWLDLWRGRGRYCRNVNARLSCLPCSSLLRYT